MGSDARCVHPVSARERARDRGLAAAAQPGAGDDDRTPEPPGIAERQADVRAGPRQCRAAVGAGDLRFGRQERLDARAHHRPVTAIERQQAWEVGIARRTRVRRLDASCQRRRAAPLEVHRQERQVGHDVAAPQPLAEFEAVDEHDPPPRTEHVDVLGVEIAVHVADEASPLPALAGSPARTRGSARRRSPGGRARRPSAPVPAPAAADARRRATGARSPPAHRGAQPVGRRGARA